MTLGQRGITLDWQAHKDSCTVHINLIHQFNIKLIASFCILTNLLIIARSQNKCYVLAWKSDKSWSTLEFAVAARFLNHQESRSQSKLHRKGLYIVRQRMGIGISLLRAIGRADCTSGLWNWANNCEFESVRFGQKVSGPMSALNVITDYGPWKSKVKWEWAHINSPLRLAALHFLPKDYLTAEAFKY